MPFLFICYVAAYLDRVNVGFAMLQMLSDLKFSETIYGLGAGIFFIGYFLFEVPSTIIMHRVGARVWIARIMITWAVLSAANVCDHAGHVLFGTLFTRRGRGRLLPGHRPAPHCWLHVAPTACANAAGTLPLRAHWAASVCF
jgi:hypothetical protein